MMKNRFSQDDVLLARQFDNLQKIYGLNLLEKGEYFKQIESSDISKSINSHFTSCSPLKRIVIKNYIFYYNNYRFQWNKKKMTPVQYRNHLNNL